MNLPLRFAVRYLFARKSYNVINMISGIGVAGMAVGTAALVIILSVFNGFNDLVAGSLADAKADLVVRPATGKVFTPDSATFGGLLTDKRVVRFPASWKSRFSSPTRANRAWPASGAWTR